MTHDDFAHFAAQARQEGFDEVLERDWPPGTVLETHRHPFALKAVVVRGEMQLNVAGSSRRLLPGDLFSLDADVPHDERYGPQGATYWVARRNS